MVSPQRAKELWPLMQTDDLVGALWLPEDGSVNATDVSLALAAGARQNGVKIFERVEVSGIDVDPATKAVRAVRTASGEKIDCRVVVNCGGQWARNIGRMAGVSVPLHSAEHYYIVTQPIEGVTRDMPIMRDPDGYTYWREWSGGILMGGFEPVCKPCFRGGKIPSKFEFQLFDDDWNHFDVLMQQALLRCPALHTAQIRQMVNGPESFTPDNQYILGEAPEVRNFFVAAGMNSSGIASAGGAGKALAEWIVKGEPQNDLWAVDIRRFGPFQNNDSFLFDRTLETLGLHYAIAWPRYEMETGRPMRQSPLYDYWKAQGAVFGSKFGWERVNWFAASPTEAIAKGKTYSWGRQPSFGATEAEHLHTRSHATLFDITSFSKFSVKGPGAAKAMQWICANEMDVPVGKIVYTGMLNERGGFEADVTVQRLAFDEYFLVAPTASTMRDFHWLETSIEQGGFQCSVRDVSNSCAVLALMGPRTRDILRQACPLSDFSNEAFPFGTFTYLSVGYATVRACRITYVGELGYELYVPQEMTNAVLQELLRAAKAAEAPLKFGGYHAIESLRIEKGYRAWGHDIGPDYTPLEAGLGFATKLSSDVPFKGRAALEQQKKEKLRRRLVSLVVKDPNAYAYGQEPIYRNGELVGSVTSTAYGHSVGSPVCLGYVRNEAGVTADFVNTGDYEVEICGVRHKASASLKAALSSANVSA